MLKNEARHGEEEEAKIWEARLLLVQTLRKINRQFLWSVRFEQGNFPELIDMWCERQYLRVRATDKMLLKTGLTFKEWISWFKVQERGNHGTSGGPVNAGNKARWFGVTKNFANAHLKFNDVMTAYFRLRKFEEMIRCGLPEGLKMLGEGE